MPKSSEMGDGRESVISLYRACVPLRQRGVPQGRLAPLMSVQPSGRNARRTAWRW
jgi:hypothetical protein